MIDFEKLRADLVTDTGEAVIAECRRWPAPDPYGGQVAPLGPDRQDIGRAAAVALLRALAKAYVPQPHEEGGEVMHFLGHWDLIRIANEIEARR